MPKFQRDEVMAIPSTVFMLFMGPGKGIETNCFLVSSLSMAQVFLSRPVFHRFLFILVLLPSRVSSLVNSKASMSQQILQTEEGQGAPVWDPVAQIYVGGVVPENAAVKQMIQENQGCLRLFGYGSLCWNPGTGALAHPSVKNRLARARGYRRYWAQKSTDHRGFPSFPGIVCTLLKDEEVKELRHLAYDQATLTEGLVYEVPPELVDECLAELDFREKGVSDAYLH